MFHPNPENEDDLNSKWQEANQKRWLQRRQELERTGEENTVQRIEEQLQLGPAEGFIEGLGAGGLGYNLDYMYTADGANADRDKNAIELAAKQVEVHNPKSDRKRKRLVGDVLGIKNRGHSYRKGRQVQTAVDRIPQADCQIGNLAVVGGGGGGRLAGS
jgi:hypothetical protein